MGLNFDVPTNVGGAPYATAINGALTALDLPVFNVKAPNFGAAGDGVTDDRAAIQDALDSASAAGGGVVFFPPGVFLLDSLVAASGTVTQAGLLVPSNITLQGAGSDVSKIKQGFATGGTVDTAPGTVKALLVNDDPASGNSFINAYDLTFESDPCPDTIGQFIYNYTVSAFMNGVSDQNVMRCRFVHGGWQFHPLVGEYGSEPEDSGNMRNVYAFNQSFESVATGFVQAQDARIVGNFFYKNYDSSISFNNTGRRIVCLGNVSDYAATTYHPPGGIEFNGQSGASSGIRDVIVANNSIRNLPTDQADGIKIINGHDVQIIGNRLDDIDACGVSVYGGDHILVANNRIKHCGNVAHSDFGNNSAGIRVISHTTTADIVGLEIAHNIISHSELDGIRIAESDNSLDVVMVHGNVVRNCGGTGIVSAGANVTSGLVTDNIAKGSTTNQIDLTNTGWTSADNVTS